MQRRGLILLGLAIAGLIGALSMSWLVGDEPLTQRLDHLGFFDHSEDPEGLRAAVRQRGGAALFEHAGRVFDVDARALADDGAMQLIERLQSFLGHQGVQLTGLAEQHDSRGDVLIRGARRVALQRPVDLERAAVDPTWLPAITLARLVRVLNGELAQAGSGQRVWISGRGERVRLVFLSPATQRVFMDCWDADRSALPYQPDEFEAGFGWPGGGQLSGGGG